MQEAKMQNGQMTLSWQNGEIHANYKVTLDAVTDAFAFSLSTVQMIDEIRANTPVTIETGETWKPTFSSPCTEYTIRGKGINSLCITYHGPVKGWCNIVTENHLTLSEYSSWYPTRLSIPLEMVVTIPDRKD